MAENQAYQKRLAAATRKALVTIGKRLRDTLRETISVPVSEDGQGRIVRSNPGEPPRKEFGKLWESVGYRVESTARTIEDLDVFSDEEIADYGMYLERGTKSIEARPWFFSTIKKVDTEVGGLKHEFKRLVAMYMREPNPVNDFLKRRQDPTDDPTDRNPEPY